MLLFIIFVHLYPALTFCALGSAFCATVPVVVAPPLHAAIAAAILQSEAINVQQFTCYNNTQQQLYNNTHTTTLQKLLCSTTVDMPGCSVCARSCKASTGAVEREQLSLCLQITAIIKIGLLAHPFLCLCHSEAPQPARFTIHTIMPLLQP